MATLHAANSLAWRLIVVCVELCCQSGCWLKSSVNFWIHSERFAKRPVNCQWLSDTCEDMSCQEMQLTVVEIVSFFYQNVVLTCLAKIGDIH